MKSPTSGDELILSVDLGGTNMRAALVDETGTVRARHSKPTPHDATAPQALLSLIGEVEAGRPRGAVIGVPGRVDYEAGLLTYAPNLPAGWKEHLSVRHLSAELGLEVSLANDADLAAVGESFFGAGRNHRDVVYMTVSTGVGAGVLLGRRLIRGRQSLAEIGHTIIELSALSEGRPASVENLASGTALAREAVAHGIEGGTAHLVELARGGDAVAGAIWAGGARAAAVAAVNLAQLFSPEVIVIGGGVSQAGDLLLAPIRDLLATHGPEGMPILVAPAGLGDDAGLVGAAAWHRAVD